MDSERSQTYWGEHLLGSPMLHKLLLLWFQASQAGPSSPEEYVLELEKFDFDNETASENHHGTIDKLRVSLSTNGLR